MPRRTFDPCPRSDGFAFASWKPLPTHWRGGSSPPSVAACTSLGSPRLASRCYAAARSAYAGLFGATPGQRKFTRLSRQAVLPQRATRTGHAGARSGNRRLAGAQLSRRAGVDRPALARLPHGRPSSHERSSPHERSHLMNGYPPAHQDEDFGTVPKCATRPFGCCGRW